MYEEVEAIVDDAPKYELVESGGFHDDHWCIKITEGEYEGLVFQYDQVKIEELDDEEGAVLHFNTITVENPNKVTLTEEEDKRILGNILVSIIDEQIKNENRTPDTETPVHG